MKAFLHWWRSLLCSIQFLTQHQPCIFHSAAAAGMGWAAHWGDGRWCGGNMWISSDSHIFHFPRNFFLNPDMNANVSTSYNRIFNCILCLFAWMHNFYSFEFQICFTQCSFNAFVMCGYSIFMINSGRVKTS